MSTSFEDRFHAAGIAAAAKFRQCDSTLQHLADLHLTESLRQSQDELLDAALVEAGILSPGDLISDWKRAEAARTRCESVCGPDGCTGACDF